MMLESGEYGIKVATHFQVRELSDQQLYICLLSSFGEPNKRIARVIDKSLRSVELDRHIVAEEMGIPTRLLFIWAVENRSQVIAEIFERGEVPSSILEMIRAFRILSPSPPHARHNRQKARAELFNKN